MSKAEISIAKMIEEAEQDLKGRTRASNPVGYDQRVQYLNDLKLSRQIIQARR